MIKLSQHGGWDSELDARARDVLATRFSEHDEDAFDFAVCQRPNGSYYGIADGKRCIKGRGPLNRMNILRDLAVRRRIPRETLKKLASVKDDKAFSKAASALAAVGQRKAGGPAITPVTKSPTSLRNQQMPKGGVDAAAKRKGDAMTAGREERKAKIGQLRAELKQKLAKKAEEKPIEQQKAEARKANMEAAAKEPKKRISTVPGGQKTSGQLLIEQLFPGQNGQPDVGDIKVKQRVYAELEKKWGPEKAEAMVRGVAPLLAMANPTARALSATMRVDEVQALQNKDNQRKLLEAYDDPSKLIGGRFEYNKQTKRLDFIPNDGKGQIIPMKWKDIDDDMAWAYYKLAPASFRNTISKAGKPDDKAFMGYDEKGNPVHGSNPANDARRLHLTKLWMAQQGRDAYTGLPLTFANADLEHIIPMEKGGKKSENPNNWVWVSNSVNQTKRAATMNDFIEGPRGKEKQRDSFNGVNNISDLDRWGRYVDKKATAAVANKEKGASIKSEVRDILEKLKADNDTRESTIALYRGGAGQKSKLDKVLKYMSDLEEAGAPSFKREIPYKNATGGSERNNAKDLLLGRGEFSTGQVRGKMSAAEWMVREWPSLSGSQRARAMNLWESIAQDWANNGTARGQTKIWIAQEFARRAGELFE